MKNIPVLRPDYTKETKKELLKVLDSGWVGQGPKTAEFEELFAKYVGKKYCVMTNSCTLALDLCLKVYNIKDGELITTPFTFVSDAWVGENNGMDVTFADIDPITLCIDPHAIKITPQTKAIIAVDSHGRLADIRAIRGKFDGLVIEDAAHACYTPHAGEYADITVWSFQAVKSLPIFDGGAITTNDEAIYKKLKTLTWLGVEKSTWDRVGKKGYSWQYDITQAQGIKAYMTDVQAVIGIGQLKRLDKLTARRREIQAMYNHAFLGKTWFDKFQDSFTVQYYTAKFKNRDKLGEFLAEKGISTSVHFYPLSETTYWKKAKKHPLPNVDSIWTQILTLPCFYSLSDREVNYIIKQVLIFYENINDRRFRDSGEEFAYKGREAFS